MSKNLRIPNDRLTLNLRALERKSQAIDILDKAPIQDQENGAKDPVVGAVMGGENARDVIMAAAMNPQHGSSQVVVVPRRLIVLGFRGMVALLLPAVTCSLIFVPTSTPNLRD